MTPPWVPAFPSMILPSSRLKRRLEPSLNVQDQPFAVGMCLHSAHKQLMVNVVEELAQAGINTHPYPAMRAFHTSRMAMCGERPGRQPKEQSENLGSNIGFMG